MNANRVARCGAAVVLLVALSAFADATAPAPSLNAANGRILTAKQARACLGGREQYGTPSASAVLRLEASLSRALAELAGRDKNSYVRHSAADVLKRMATDVRFYIATADGFIQVRGYCADFPEPAPRACPPLVEDGGSCIWLFRFDTKRGTFDRFGTNGEG